MTTNERKIAYLALIKAIELAGGQSALANICGGSIKQGHVRNWLCRNKNKCLPAEYAIRVSTALNIPCNELRPDIYPG